MFRSYDHLQGATPFLVKVTCDFSKERCSSLKMILGSKHVGAILSVLMCNFMYVH